MIPAGAKLPLQIATILKEELHEIGIEMSIQRLEWAVFLQKINDDDFDGCTLGWALGWENDPYQIWHSSQAVKGGSNFVGFRNGEADKLIVEARKNSTRKKGAKCIIVSRKSFTTNSPIRFFLQARLWWRYRKDFKMWWFTRWGLLRSTGGRRKRLEILDVRKACLQGILWGLDLYNIFFPIYF